MLNFIRKQFIDVIQWENPDEDTLVWRFPIADQEIQNGASLTVRESQAAVFVDEGVVADVFLPGRYTLNTQTLPVLTNLRNWDKFFQSQAMVEKLQPAFAALGLALESFTVESVTLPENVQQALDKRMSMNIVGDLGTYTQYQTAESIPLAAQNEGGLAGMGAGMGVGVGIGQAMAGAMSNTAAPNVQAASAPAADPNAKLAQLKTMLDNGLITQADYDSAKEQVLKQLLG